MFHVEHHEHVSSQSRIRRAASGKTTTAINLAASLAAADMRTLLIDLDPQSNASSGLGLRKKSYPKSTYDVLVHGEPLSAILHQTELEALKLAPGKPGTRRGDHGACPRRRTGISG